jgi:hypothetical protein
MACIVLVEIHREIDRPPVTDLARTIEMSDTANLPPLDVKETLNAMFDHGRRYRNMET